MPIENEERNWGYLGEEELIRYDDNPYEEDEDEDGPPDYKYLKELRK